MDGVVSGQNYLKGLTGEKYIAQKISELGYKVLYVGGCQLYSIIGEKFYSVDLALFGKEKTFWVQAKHKEPRKYYPDTGMEKWRYDKLIKHQKESGLPVLVLFTDSTRNIYGDWLDNISKCLSPYKKWNQKDNTEMIYWLLEKLKDYKSLLSNIED